MLKLTDLLSDCLILDNFIQDKALESVTYATSWSGLNDFESHQHITSEKESVETQVIGQ